MGFWKDDWKKIEDPIPQRGANGQRMHECSFAQSGDTDAHRSRFSATESSFDISMGAFFMTLISKQSISTPPAEPLHLF